MILIFAIGSGLVVSCSEEQSGYPISKNERHVFYDSSMRPPVPVIVDVPSTISDLELPDSVCLIGIQSHIFQFTYLSDTCSCRTVNQLDSVVSVRCGPAFKNRVALKVDSMVSTQRIDAVIQVLKANGIVRFNLITDLEEK